MKKFQEIWSFSIPNRSKRLYLNKTLTMLSKRSSLEVMGSSTIAIAIGCNILSLETSLSLRLFLNRKRQRVQLLQYLLGLRGSFKRRRYYNRTALACRHDFGFCVRCQFVNTTRVMLCGSIRISIIMIVYGQPRETMSLSGIDTDEEWQYLYWEGSVVCHPAWNSCTTVGSFSVF